MLEHFKGEFVTVFTKSIVDGGQDEDGNALSARQAFVGWLLEYDTEWLVLGEVEEDRGYPRVLVCVADIHHIELKLDEHVELSNIPESDILN